MGVATTTVVVLSSTTESHRACCVLDGTGCSGRELAHAEKPDHHMLTLDQGGGFPLIVWRILGSQPMVNTCGVSKVLAFFQKS